MRTSVDMKPSDWKPRRFGARPANSFGVGGDEGDEIEGLAGRYGPQDTEPRQGRGVVEEGVSLSTLVAKLNDRFGTDFTEADQFFFDQIRATAEGDEKIVEAARANNLSNFSSYLERMMDELFIDRMEGNEEIFSRVMSDMNFRSAAHEHLALEIFQRVRARMGQEITDF